MLSDVNSHWEFEQRRRENEQLRKRLSQSSVLGQRIASSLELPTVLLDIVAAASGLVCARYGPLSVFDDSGRVRTFVTHGITAEQRERLGPSPRGLGLLGLLHQDQKTPRLPDLSTHPRSVGFPPNHPPMKSFPGSPIRLDSEPLGILYLTEKIEGIEFTAEDEDVFMLFASQAALAIHNAQQYEALEEERQWLESVVRLSPVGVLMIEAASEQVLMANREAERILDFSYRPGSTSADFRDASGTSEFDETHPIWQALTKGEVVRAEEVVHTHADRWTVPTLISVTPVYGED